MAYIRWTILISLLLYDFQPFGPDNVEAQQIIEVPTTAILPFFPELQFDANFFQQYSPRNNIVKRNVNDTVPLPSTPQVFKFDLDDAKEPDEETKKLIQKRLRELELEDKDIEIISNKTDLSKRSKRATTKGKPVLIPFLIEDAREPDSATKELIRRSRAKDVSVSKIKEIARDSQESITEKRESPRKRRVKAPTHKDPQGQGRIKSIPLSIENKEPLRKEPQDRFRSVILSTEDKEPLRKGKVQSVPLTSFDKEGLRESRSKSRQQSNKKTQRKRSKRYAQLSEPRYIKFELHDAKNPKMEANNEVQIMPRQPFGTKIQSQTSDANGQQYGSDTTAEGTKYRYFFQQAPRKYHLLYPKRYEPKDVVFRVSKMQKYIASGQGLENINTNIEISIPPTVSATAVLGGYPKPVYGQKLCQYGTHGCQAAQVVAVPSVNLQLNKPVAPQQNSVAENEVIPEQHTQQQFYYVYPQPEPAVNQHQNFVPIANPYQNAANVHVPAAEEQQQQSHQQEVQNVQNLIDSNKIGETEAPPVKIAYVQPTYGYGSKIYPTYSATANIIQHTPANHDQNTVVIGSNQDVARNQEPSQETQLNLLKDNQEFQELSALIGKSPEDQFHGLSYLLAKEMQKQKSSNSQQRPQDQTSPILFHPADSGSVSTTPQPQLPVQKPIYEEPKVENSHVVPFRPLKPLLNTVLTTALTQVVQPKQEVEHQEQAVVTLTDAAQKAVGLSPNYNGVDSHTYSPATKIYSSENDDDANMEYASKYAFGYRVRDFHSGNDFAHKQNRDHDGVTRGQYHILMPDGRIQNVVYYADDTGFHADVSY